MSPLPRNVRWSRAVAVDEGVLAEADTSGRFPVLRMVHVEVLEERGGHFEVPELRGAPSGELRCGLRAGAQPLKVPRDAVDEQGENAGIHLGPSLADQCARDRSAELLLRRAEIALHCAA